MGNPLKRSLSQHNCIVLVSGVLFPVNCQNLWCLNIVFFEMATGGASYADTAGRFAFDQNGTTLELQTKLGLEFQMSDLNERVDIDDKLVPEIHKQLLQIVNEDDIIGIEFRPSKRFAQKCITVFANENAKGKVQVRGLSLFRKSITLTNPGQGVMKVELSNVSMLVPNDVIKDWLASKVGGIGNIVQFRNDHYIINGQKRKWVSGLRFAYVKNLAAPLPPADKFRYNSKDIQVNIWHYGQTHMKCRFCYQIVLKGHECARRQVRQGCHKCGSLAHLQRECPGNQSRKCFRCGSAEHLQSECTIEVRRDGTGMGGNKTTYEGKVPNNNSAFQRRSSHDLIPNLIDQALEKKKAEDEAKKEKEAAGKKKKQQEREKQNQDAIQEREQQLQDAIEQNRKEKEEDDRKKRAAVAAAAAEKRNASAASSSEESLPTDALKLETSCSSMEVDPTSDDEESEEDGEEEVEEEPHDEDDTSSGEISEEIKPDDDEEQVDSSSTDEDDGQDSDRLDTTQFHDAFDTALQLSPQKARSHQAATVALVGGSNVPHIKLVSDRDLQVQTHALWEGGAVIIQGAAKVAEANPETREKFDVIVTHLGTCNFPCKGESSVMSHFKDYMDMTSKVREMCPEALIVMSGLLPQAGEDRQLANEQIKSFNSALKAVGDDEKEPFLYYCDNWPHFVESDQVLHGLFKDPDTFGVHVNDKGSVVLAQSIMQRVKQVFYWERLGVPLSPSH